MVHLALPLLVDFLSHLTDEANVTPQNAIPRKLRIPRASTMHRISNTELFRIFRRPAVIALIGSKSFKTN